MLWIALVAAVGAFVLLLLRHWSPINAAANGVGLLAVLAAIALSQELPDLPAPVLILSGAVEGHLPRREQHAKAHATRQSERHTGELTAGTVMGRGSARCCRPRWLEMTRRDCVEA
jgi:hypothetical protein